MTAAPVVPADGDLLPLVCPEVIGAAAGRSGGGRCGGALVPAEAGGLRCRACGALFPRRAAVPVLLSGDEWQAFRAHLDSEAAAREAYARARRNAPLTIRYFDWWVARMLGEIPPGVSGAFVELMCGGAEVCRRLPARFTTAVALDVDVDMVEQAARDLAAAGDQRVRLVCGTAARVPLPDACTSVVVVQGALHHARPILGDILREIHRLLRPGGVLVGSEPANDHPLTRAIREWQYRHSALQGNDPEEEGFDRDELAGELAAAGLRLDRYRQFGFIAYPLMGNTDFVPLLRRARSMRLGNALLWLDERLESVPVIRRLAWASLFRAFKE
jgi:SAM-dependent methyltransferase